MDPLLFCFSCVTLALLFNFRVISGATFTFVNKCDYTVWPGILANAGTPKLDSTGFELPKSWSRSFQAPPSWSGRFWGRTGCTFNPNTGQGTCLTGDCGSNQIECNGLNAIPPATLAEFTIGSGSTEDYYDVSLVDGYNLPIIVQPSGGSGNCLATGCVTDLNRQCPNELRVGSGDACKSACEAFGNPEYCCSGAYGSPDTCKPSMYSEMFKSACPRSYSYAYDDASSTFTCTGADYTITFCPSSTSQKRETSSPTTNGFGSTEPIEEEPVVTEPIQEPPEEEEPIGSSWLPVVLTGDSIRYLSCSVMTSTSTAFAISILFLL